MEDKKVSIIIPIYNSGNHLELCLKSIIAQTYRNLEILLIDDGSKDNSALICREYQIKDERISYFYKTNGGVSSARNYGLEKMTGDYVTFIDSDDYVEVNHIKVLFEGILGKEISVSGYKKIINHKEEIFCISNTSNFNNKMLLKLLVTDPKVNGYSCNKMFKTSIILENNITFDNELKYGEDLYFCFEYCTLITKGTVLNKATYNYVQHEDNTSGSIYNYNDFKTRLTFINSLLKCLELLSHEDTEIQDVVRLRIAKTGSYYFQISKNIRTHANLSKEIMKQIDPSVNLVLKRKIKKTSNTEFILVFINRYIPKLSFLGYKIIMKK